MEGIVAGDMFFFFTPASNPRTILREARGLGCVPLLPSLPAHTCDFNRTLSSALRKLADFFYGFCLRALSSFPREIRIILFFFSVVIDPACGIVANVVSVVCFQVCVFFFLRCARLTTLV